MPLEVLYSVIGALFTVIFALVLFALKRLYAQGDDTNKKVTEQAAAAARLETTVDSLCSSVDVLNSWREKVIEREQRNTDDEKRHNVRRLEDRRLIGEG